MKKLNAGCGLDIKPKEEGWINLDQHDKCGADVIHDLTEIPLPFPDNHFGYVYCSHVLEDFSEPLETIKEFIRITKPKGLIEIKTPFETNQELTNMNHKTSFTLSKFRSITTSWGNENYGEKPKVRIKELHYYEDSGNNKYFQGFKKLVASFYNLLPISLVERSFIKYLFCVVNCRVVYEKLE